MLILIVFAILHPQLLLLLILWIAFDSHFFVWCCFFLSSAIRISLDMFFLFMISISIEFLGAIYLNNELWNYEMFAVCSLSLSMHNHFKNCQTHASNFASLCRETYGIWQMHSHIPYAPNSIPMLNCNYKFRRNCLRWFVKFFIHTHTRKILRKMLEYYILLLLLWFSEHIFMCDKWHTRMV